MKKLSFNHNIYKTFFLWGFLLLALLSFAPASSAFNFAADTGLSTTGANAGYNPSNAPSPELIIGEVIKLVLGLLGVVFLAFMIWAGLEWMTAQGNDQKVAKAKQMITEAIVGLIIVSAAYAIAYFVISYFGSN
ncbi:MAG: pilin [Patescibacteria group bacterium]